jgi:hypothetical protein
MYWVDSSTPPQLCRKFVEFLVLTGVKPEGGLQPPKWQFKKNASSVDMVISDVLHDLPFSRKQSLKSADNQYIGVLKNKIKT